LIFTAPDALINGAPFGPDGVLQMMKDAKDLPEQNYLAF
jgi:hypothetical protein